MVSNANSCAYSRRRGEKSRARSYKYFELNHFSPVCIREKYMRFVNCCYYHYEHVCWFFIILHFLNMLDICVLFRYHKNLEINGKTDLDSIPTFAKCG